jgi:hypothetical protein
LPIKKTLSYIRRKKKLTDVEKKMTHVPSFSLVKARFKKVPLVQVPI